MSRWIASYQGVPINNFSFQRSIGLNTDSAVIEFYSKFAPKVLPPPQRSLEERYRAVLWDRFGLRFNRLLTLANLPVMRFAEALLRRGELESYMDLLVTSFNPATVPELMCRNLISVS